MEQKKIWKLEFKALPKQAEALKYLSDDHTTEIGYGGGGGGGKSFLGVGWVSGMAVGYANTAWFLGRKELKRLKQSTLVSFFEYCQLVGLVSGQHFNYNAQDSTITFLNNSVIYLYDLAYQPSDPLFARFGSVLLTGGFIDESAEVPFKAVDILHTRVGRWKNKELGLTPKILETFNPDKGHVYSRFYKPHVNGTLPEYRSFTRALPTDNPYLPQSYITQLQRADKVTMERLLYGNFEYDDDPAKLFEVDDIYDLFTNHAEKSDDWYLSVDVARLGADKTVFMVWKGLRIHTIDHRAKTRVTETIRIANEYRGKHGIRMSHVVVDEDGVGGGVVDGLDGCRGFVNNSVALYDSDLQEKPNFANLKTQCYFELARLVALGKIEIRCDDETVKTMITEELEQVKQKDVDKDKPISLVGKEVIKQNIGRSPDFADALMMRMIFEVHKEPEPGLFVG